jgi:hypothetical protein
MTEWADALLVPSAWELVLSFVVSLSMISFVIVGVLFLLYCVIRFVTALGERHES